jgi:hypothetical protein
MDSRAIEAELADLEKEAAPIIHQLDACVDEFAEAVPAHAAEWIRRETERQVERNADRLVDFGKPRLSALKGELAELIAQLPELARSAVAARDARPHNRPVVRMDAALRPTDYFSDAYRTVVSHLGALLARAGLLPERGRDPTWDGAGAGQYRYRISTGFESLRIPPVAEYQRLYGRFHDLALKIDGKRKALSRAKARELWESA